MNPKLQRALVAVALLALALPAAAAAHANLVRTDPANGAVLAQAPSAVRVVFDDVVRVGPGIEAVRNGGGSVLGGAPTASGDTLTIPLRSHLRDGDYSVRWSIISDDGHLESGVLAFAVGAGSAAPTSDLKAEATGPSAGTTFARWLFLAGILAAVGISLYALVVLREADRRIAITLGVAAAAAAVGAGEEAYRIGLDVRYGAASAAGFFLALLVVLGAIVVLRPALYLALGLAVVPSVSGHALDPGIPAINIAFDVLHVLAAAAWVGLLLGIVVVGREGRRGVLLATAGVVVLGITGVLRAVFELTSLSQLWTTSYGQALLVKTGLVLAAVGIGWLLRARARRRAVIELAFVVAIVGVAAVLVQLRPGRNYVSAAAHPVSLEPGPNPPPPPAGAVVLAQEAGQLAVALESQPKKTTAVVLSPAGGGMSGLSVRFLPSGVAASSCGSGCYSAAVPLHGRVGVSIDGFGPQRVATFDVPTHAPPAGKTVRAFRRAYRALPGVTYLEHLASSPTDAIDARWRLERPNRMSYMVDGEGGGIVIGTRRWDQASKHGPWVPRSQSPVLPQPNTLWERATNAHVLSVDGRWETISFADPELGAFFTATFDRRTLRPRVVHMVATAHFMTDRYVSFNPAREIRPPRAPRRAAS
ncbi:MAG TPA: copper resistance protein CopC [Gaiellaceae bacterium]|jgi:copper transport protein